MSFIPIANIWIQKCDFELRRRSMSIVILRIDTKYRCKMYRRALELRNNNKFKEYNVNLIVNTIHIFEMYFDSNGQHKNKKKNIALQPI